MASDLLLYALLSETKIASCMISLYNSAQDSCSALLIVYLILILFPLFTRDTQQNHCVNVLETITCTQNQLQYIIYQYA